MTNNLVLAVWSHGVTRIYSGDECIYEDNLFKDSMVNEDVLCSNCKATSHTYEMTVGDDQTTQKAIYIALGLQINNNKTLVKVYSLNFSRFRVNRAIDEQQYRFKGGD
jgi:hypothetical protein